MMTWHVCESGWQLPKAEKLELAEVIKNFAAVETAGNLVIIYWGSLVFPSPEHYFESAMKHLHLDKDGYSFLEQHLIKVSQECHSENWKI